MKQLDVLANFVPGDFFETGGVGCCFASTEGLRAC